MFRNIGRGTQLIQGAWVRKDFFEEVMIRLSFKGGIGITPTENEGKFVSNSEQFVQMLV